MVTKCRINEGWMDEGREGTVFCQIFAEQWWTVLLWDDEEDPDIFKSSGLDFFEVEL